MADNEVAQQMIALLQMDVPTIEKYKTVAKELDQPEVVETLPAGGSIGWFGSKTASKVVGYIPGGGFVHNASVPQVQMAHDVYGDYKARLGDDVALAVLAYDLVTVNPFPAQLHQAVQFINRLLKDRQAGNVDLFGDSAGGALIIGSVLHINHAHPKTDPLSLPPGQSFGRVLLMSPSGPNLTSAASFTDNRDVDQLKPEVLSHLWNTIEQKENHDPDIPLASPWLAPALKMEEDWYADWPVASTHIIWGDREILRDDIVKVAKVIKARSGKPVTLEGIPEAGHCPFVGERLMKLPPGPYALAITKWGQSD